MVYHKLIPLPLPRKILGGSYMLFMQWRKYINAVPRMQRYEPIMQGYAPSSRIHHVLHDDCATALQHYRTCVLDSMKYFSKLKELGMRARRDNTYVHELKKMYLYTHCSKCTHSHLLEYVYAEIAIRLCSSDHYSRISRIIQCANHILILV